jgi:hypothetical protein
MADSPSYPTPQGFSQPTGMRTLPTSTPWWGCDTPLPLNL